MFLYLAAVGLVPGLLAFCIPGGPDNIDANSDGKISLSETKAYFLAQDSNGDGEVTLTEFTEAVDKIDSQFAGNEVFLFAVFDRDGNGQVNKADIDQAFDIADMNKNDYIDPAELRLLTNMVSLAGLIMGRP